MSSAEKAYALEVSRAKQRDEASSSGSKREGDSQLMEDIKLKRGRRVRPVGTPGEKREDLEAALKDKWVVEAVLILKELDLPVVKIAALTADPERIVSRRFTNHQGSTVKGRVMLWRRLKTLWLQPQSIGWPDRIQLLD